VTLADRKSLSDRSFASQIIGEGSGGYKAEYCRLSRMQKIELIADVSERIVKMPQG